MGVAEVGTLGAVWVLYSADYLWQKAGILLKPPFAWSLIWIGNRFDVVECSQQV